mmetsp:Transcript_127/g.966  ORF Transcript_127/g.966 Transcript_127/m.966 type:complete len:213 (-) Transcript_127:1016-1654(-)
MVSSVNKCLNERIPVGIVLWMRVSPLKSKCFLHCTGTISTLPSAMFSFRGGWPSFFFCIDLSLANTSSFAVRRNFAASAATSACSRAWPIPCTTNNRCVIGVCAHHSSSCSILMSVSYSALVGVKYPLRKRFPPGGRKGLSPEFLLRKKGMALSKRTLKSSVHNQNSFGPNIMACNPSSASPIPCKFSLAATMPLPACSWTIPRLGCQICPR